MWRDGLLALEAQKDQLDLLDDAAGGDEALGAGGVDVGNSWGRKGDGEYERDGKVCVL